MMTEVELLGFTVLSVALYAINYKAALKWKVFSSGNFRREFQPIPLLGGVGLLLSLVVGELLFHPPYLSELLISSVPLLVVGWLDDIYELKARLKSVGHIVAAILWMFLTHRLGGGAEMVVLALCLGSFWVMTMVNAVNMVDGVDGQASLFGLVAMMALGVLEPRLLELSTLLSLAVLVFLGWNLPKAKQFLGEVGSSFLGFAVAVVAIEFVMESAVDKTVDAVFSVLFICAFPCVDLCMAIFRRVTKKISPFAGDQEHIHHRLQRIGVSPWGLLAITGGLTTYCASTGYLLWSIEINALKVLAAIMSTAILLFVLKGVYFCEYRLGLQVLSYGTELLQRKLRFDRGVKVGADSFGCVVVDLLPYYKVLQRRGVRDLERFIDDIVMALSREESVKQKTLVRGRLVVLFYDVKESEHLFGEELLFRWFFDITYDHGLMKNDTLRPEGVEYYSSRFPGTVLRLVKVLGDSGVQIQSKKLAS